MRQDQKAALADLDDAIRLESSSSVLLLTEDHLTRGRLLYEQKDFDGAVRACGIVFGLHPNDPRAYRLRAEALLELKRPTEALQALDDCLKHGPADAGAFRARAALRTQLGQYAGAQTDYTRSLELEPDAATFAARGWCYLVADAPKLAVTDFDEAIRLAPELGDAYAGRASSRVQRGDLLLAAKDAEKASECGPPTPRLSYNIARIYAQALTRLDLEPTLLPRRKADLLRVDWQNRAMKALTQALDLQSPDEAGRFWKNVVHPDKALNPLRRDPRFNRLAAR
jgi:tetratricopeptide (TPR) repeat protein